ncbi:methylated-DNA--[protein]-cysteine S-methyltransferase [Paramicrobacterium agarici]|uniref:Methylated-DNA--protein-cysteine methyltransferase n=1 Tax=Paramicrobacterium agarici TaxID=630514 RepID=A0A2A9DS60_9MICO|nr:methylated-DNA--[protein]-cysteine S-methyltransferase [Microbacterium agarici]PFG29196.1 methylated-DNA-[protein]-cysteine S-methyltransferase [Microbacterium agarici]
MTTVHSVVDSPIGPLTLVGETASGHVRLTAVWMASPRHDHAEGLGVRDGAVLAGAARQLDEYFAGERTVFDLDLDPVGTDFEKKVWMLLRDIPYGQTRSYGELAADLGDPRLSRAVGTANGRNPLSIVVPCHRVIGADGSLTGYAGGLERKRFLLSLERDGAPAADWLF